MEINQTVARFQGKGRMTVLDAANYFAQSHWAQPRKIVQLSNIEVIGGIGGKFGVVDGARTYLVKWTPENDWTVTVIGY